MKNNLSPALLQQMLSGQEYDDLSPELTARRHEVVLLTDEYNQSFGKDKATREQLLRGILEHVGHNVHFAPAFHCEFGWNITIGDDFFANFNCIMLDANKIVIGNHVLIGPNVGLYTANHSLNAQRRKEGYCSALPIVIEDNVWIGAGVHIMGGVTIGENAVIGAGSVVTHSIPPNCIAAGNPCRIIRKA